MRPVLFFGVNARVSLWNFLSYVSRGEKIHSIYMFRGKNYTVTRIHISEERKHGEHFAINLLTPNVNYSGRTAPLTSKVAFYIFIQQI